MVGSILPEVGPPVRRASEPKVCGLELDPYAGSGTTLLAAQELGRRWIGIELNPSYVDLIERRVLNGAASSV